ncbi:MAG: hypothetical protein AAF621_05930, partial [Pseudomonadota bacterium]
YKIITEPFTRGEKHKSVFPIPFQKNQPEIHTKEASGDAYKKAARFFGTLLAIPFCHFFLQHYNLPRGQEAPPVTSGAFWFKNVIPPAKSWMPQGLLYQSLHLLGVTYPATFIAYFWRDALGIPPLMSIPIISGLGHSLLDMTTKTSNLFGGLFVANGLRILMKTEIVDKIMGNLPDDMSKEKRIGLAVLVGSTLSKYWSDVVKSLREGHNFSDSLKKCTRISAYAYRFPSKFMSVFSATTGMFVGSEYISLALKNAFESKFITQDLDTDLITKRILKSPAMKIPNAASVLYSTAAKVYGRLYDWMKKP